MNEKERKKERGRELGIGIGSQRKRELGETGKRERITAGDMMQLNIRCWSLFDNKQNTRHVSWKISSCPEATVPIFLHSIISMLTSVLSSSDYLDGKNYNVNEFSSRGTQ